MSYGAPLGQPDRAEPAPRVHLARVRINAGGYDSGGTYWGIGQPLYQYGADGRWSYLRATSREAAKEKIRAMPGWAGARFWR